MWIFCHADMVSNYKSLIHHVIYDVGLSTGDAASHF